jgi:hypothetical protein
MEILYWSRIAQGSHLARLPPPQNAAEVFLINCKWWFPMRWYIVLLFFMSKYPELVLSFDYSPKRSDLWMWWLDIFIPHDFHPSFCHYIPEIWKHEVKICCPYVFLFVSAYLWNICSMMFKSCFFFKKKIMSGFVRCLLGAWLLFRVFLLYLLASITALMLLLHG